MCPNTERSSTTQACARIIPFGGNMVMVRLWGWVYIWGYWVMAFFLFSFSPLLGTIQQYHTQLARKSPYPAMVLGWGGVLGGVTQLSKGVVRPWGEAGWPRTGHEFLSSMICLAKILEARRWNHYGNS